MVLVVTQICTCHKMMELYTHYTNIKLGFDLELQLREMLPLGETKWRKHRSSHHHLCNILWISTYFRARHFKIKSGIQFLFYNIKQLAKTNLVLEVRIVVTPGRTVTRRGWGDEGGFWAQEIWNLCSLGWMPFMRVCSLCGHSWNWTQKFLHLSVQVCYMPIQLQ